MLSENEMRIGARCGLDSHADMSCTGKHVRILEILEGQTCEVFPFNENHYEPIPKIRIINGAFSTETIYGETIVVELNHALNFTKSMEHSLLCVNQARENGV